MKKKAPRTDAEICQMPECYVGFKLINGEITLMVGPVPEDLPKGQSAPITVTRKAARRLLIELAKAVTA